MIRNGVVQDPEQVQGMAPVLFAPQKHRLGYKAGDPSQRSDT